LRRSSSQPQAIRAHLRNAALSIWRAKGQADVDAATYLTFFSRRNRVIAVAVASFAALLLPTLSTPPVTAGRPHTSQASGTSFSTKISTSTLPSSGTVSGSAEPSVAVTPPQGSSVSNQEHVPSEARGNPEVKSIPTSEVPSDEPPSVVTAPTPQQANPTPSIPRSQSEVAHLPDSTTTQAAEQAPEPLRQRACRPDYAPLAMRLPSTAFGIEQPEMLCVILRSRTVLIRLKSGINKLSNV